jgi:hypothetical protein
MKKVISIPLVLIFIAITKVVAQEVIHPQSIDVLRTIVASGLMGDYNNIAINENWQDTPCSEQSDSLCVKFEYIPGQLGWAGIYWLNIPNDWCNGRDLSSFGYREIVFYARGENGGEFVEFKAGDIKCPDNSQQRDSFRVSIGKIRLTREWRRYSIDLRGLNLSNAIGLFCWVASGPAHPNGLTFYLDDVLYVR